MAEGEEAPPVEEEKKKKGMKGLIIKIVPLLLIALVVAKMTVLAPPPPTAAQKAAKAAVARNTLEIKCAKANNKPPPAPLDPKAAEAEAAGMKVEQTKGGPTTTVGLTSEPATAQGPVLTLDSVTVNLADGHFLSLGLGLQMKVGTVIDTVKLENPGTAALSYVITQLRQKTTADLGPKALEPLRETLGYNICAGDGEEGRPALNFDGVISTIYFTDFVTQ